MQKEIQLKSGEIVLLIEKLPRWKEVVKMSKATDRIKKRSAENEEFRKEYLRAKERSDFADLIYDLKQESGLNQSQFAKKVKKNRSTISRIENSTMDPSLTLVNEIAAEFGKEVKVELVDKK